MIFNHHYMIRLAYSALILFLLTIAITIYSFSMINNSRIILIDLYQLKSDVLIANIAMRNSAIATNQFEMNKELDKMAITRESANKIYDRLSSYNLNKQDSVIISEMKRERTDYRKAQLEVIENIKKKNDNFPWSMYNVLMEKYLQRIDVLVQSQIVIVKDTFTTTKNIIIVIFSNLILLLLICGFSFFKRSV